MTNYIQIKKILKEHKRTMSMAIGGSVIFLLGFGTGRGLPAAAAKPIASPPHYATEVPNTPAKAGDTANSKTKTAPKITNTIDTSNCPVKGNISSSGEK